MFKNMLRHKANDARITKKNSHKKEKSQMPFPTDRALNDADKEKTGLYQKKTVNK